MKQTFQKEIKVANGNLQVYFCVAALVCLFHGSFLPTDYGDLFCPGPQDRYARP